MSERDGLHGAAPGASAAGVAGIDLGPLRNGLGSLTNLELLLKSIKVGQKALFAAVTDVHADCAPMIASAERLRQSLEARGVDGNCALRLCDSLVSNLKALEGELSRTVDSGRLSVAARLELEGEIARASRELRAALPLATLLDRATRNKPLELTPVELIHAASAEGSDPEAVSVRVEGADAGSSVGLGIDLDAAKLLVAVGVALVIQGQPEQMASVCFGGPERGAMVTTIERGRASGQLVRLAAPRVVEPTLLCASVAIERMGGSLEYSPNERRARIFWPPS